MPRAMKCGCRTNAPFLKGGTQRNAADASAVWEDDPKPTARLSGLAAG